MAPHIAEEFGELVTARGLARGLANMIKARVHLERSKKNNNMLKRGYQSDKLSRNFKIAKRQTVKLPKTKTRTNDKESKAQSLRVQGTMPEESLALPGQILPLRTKSKETINGFEVTDFQKRKHKVTYNKSVVPQVLEKIALGHHERLKIHYDFEHKILGPEESRIHPNLPHANQPKFEEP